MEQELILARALHLAAMIALAGSLAFSVLVAEPALRASSTPRTGEAVLHRSLSRLASLSFIVALLSGLLWLVLEARSMSGLPLAAVYAQGVIAKVLRYTNFGRVWELRFALAVLLAGVLLARDRRGPDKPARAIGWAALLLGAGMLAAVGWAGHASATLGPEGTVHLVADALHLLAAGAWLGGLYPLARLFAVAMRQAGWVDVARAATRRFSLLGMVSVGTLLVTGLVNSWFLVGSIPGLLGTPYGWILLLKLALFAIMVAVAAFNRQRLTPRLLAPGAPLSALRALRRNALIETGLGLAILLLVGALGATPPALHTQPQWPLPFRIDVDALSLDRRTLLDVAMIALGMLLLLRAGLGRRRWPSGLVGAALVLGFAWPLLSASMVEAYPTTYYRAPSASAAPAIARGAGLYEEHCASCHGADGSGGGPAAQGLAKKPADLTAAHLFAHSSGDLFWWISRGRGDAMPGFADIMDERQRWDVIGFIRARAAAGQAHALLPEVSTGPAPLAPDFAFEQSGSQATLRQAVARGPLLLVLYRLPSSLPRLGLLAAEEGRLAAAGLRVLAVPIDPRPGDAESAPTLLDFAATTGADTATAYALFEGAGETGHCEFLIDRAGLLRARWQSGAAGGLADPAALLTQLARLAALPPRQQQLHVHDH